jgi:hypothetical protein
MALEHELAEKSLSSPRLMIGEPGRLQTMPQTFNVGSQSRFVTFVAWLFLLLSAFACAWAMIQNATQSAWVAELGVDRSVLPWLSGKLVHYLPWVLSTAAAFSLAMLVCSVGLLKRVEWTRRVFIGLLVVVIGVDLGSLWLQQEFAQLFVESALRQATLPQKAAALFDGMITTARVLAGFLTLAAGFAIAGIIRRLMSPAVRQEFA